MAREQRRLAAIVAADVVGYSRLMGRDESGTLARLREHRKQRFEPTLTRHGGRLVKLTGDGALAEFGSAVDALSAAIEIQQAMAEANRDQPEDTAIVFRIGLHLGDLIVEEDDLYGDGVNVAARLEAEAPAGGIVVSYSVRDAVDGRLKATLRELGDLALKNIERPIRAFLVEWNPAEWRTPVTVSPAAAPSEAPLALPDKPSIAVLPFQNMSGDPEQEYFADGMVEDIITALSRFRSLFVIARNSSFTYKGRAVDIKQVGRELGARYILEGSVRKAAGRVRITGQLIDSETGTHLWADRFDGSLDDIFELQDRVTAVVVGAVAPMLDHEEIVRAKRKPVENLNAYDCFLRGMARMHEDTRQSYEEALRLFYRAIDLDGDFATPYGMVARCYAHLRGLNWSVDKELEEREIRRMAARVSAIGKGDGLALCSAGFAMARVCREDDVGIAMVDQALSTNENLAVGWRYRGGIRVMVGRHEAAIEDFSRAVRLSPLDPESYWAEGLMAAAHVFLGRNAEGLAWATRALAHWPDHALSLWFSAIANALSGDIEEARRFMPRIRQLNPELRISTLREYYPVRGAEEFEMFREGLRLAGLPE